jgi:hypothetical protein
MWIDGGTAKQMKDLTPEQRKRVEEAIAEAKRALEKARKDLPEGFVMPDIDAILNSSMYFHTLTPGAVSVAPYAFDSKEFKEQMEKMKDSIHKNFDTYRLTIPKIYATPHAQVFPAVPSAPVIPSVPQYYYGSPELRNEMRELRKELEQLREEMRREKGKKDGEEKKPGLTETYNL